MIGEPFMQIRQALGDQPDPRPWHRQFLTAVIEDLKASGFIRDALRRSGQDSALVAPA
jgi:polar amino acid transport system substrate-binding protein